MWKRTDGNSGDLTSNAASQSGGAADRSGPIAGLGKRGSKEAAVIGRSVTIKGEVTGSEDVQVLGRIEGTVKLDDHQLHVGSGGFVNADIVAREVEVEGEVEGDIEGHEKIVIRDSGRVRGNIKAPKVVLEEGSQFRGAVEMDVSASSSSYGSGSSTSATVTSLSDTDRTVSG